MHGLNALPGMRDALERAVLRGTTPFLGICVGMQMLFERGHEHGNHAGLGWFKGEVEMIAPADPALRIPHMGWNRLKPAHPEHKLLEGIAGNDYVYFVHSYAATHANSAEIIATTDYGSAIVAMIGRGHIAGTQFHPEKSQRVGLRLIRNFLEA
jgi:glutamine amidotransferase